MDKIKIDLKTLILIISTACVVAGFYYTTKARLDAVEMEMSFLQGQVRTLKAADKRLNKQIRNLKKEQPK